MPAKAMTTDLSLSSRQAGGKVGPAVSNHPGVSTMMLQLKRLITAHPHRPWRMPRRLLVLSVMLFGFLAWLLGVLGDKEPWPRQPTQWIEPGVDG